MQHCDIREPSPVALYLSPEQARGETAGPRSDIYSLGIVLYEMVTGALPFQGETPIGVALKHIQEEPPRPSSLNPAVSPGLEKVIARAMAKIPADRYETAREMSADLEVVSGTVPGEPNRVVPVDEFATRVIPTVKPTAEGLRPVSEPRENKKRRPGWFWAALIVLLLLATGVAAFQYYIKVSEVTMPAVEGKPQAEAESTLQQLGIKNIQVFLNTHPTVPQGRVISQEPQQGATIKVRRNVTLTVSQGPELSAVPDVIGLPLNDARIKINQSELNVADPVQWKFSNDIPQGVVLDQDPRSGKNLSKGSGVTLFVSKGPQPVTHPAPGNRKKKTT